MTIECDTLSKSIKNGRESLNLLQQVSFKLPPGSVTALVGPNGAGKSTLLRILAGLDRQFEAGRLAVGGHDVAKLDARDVAKLISWVPARHDTPFAFTALETVVMGLFASHQGRPAQSDYEKATAVLTELCVEHLKNRDITTLSSGERQKIMLARGLVAETPVILLDEPLVNLDIAAALQVLELLKRAANLGKTVVYAIHDLALAAQFSDYAVVLQHGRTVSAAATSSALTPEVIAKTFHVNVAWAHTNNGRTTLLCSPKS